MLLSKAWEAGVGGIMCAHNKVNGTKTCAHTKLLQHDLKGKMDFQGFVQSEPHAASASNAIEQGLDQDMPGTDKLFDDLSSWDRSKVDGAAHRVLSSMFRSRLDENPGCMPPNCQAEREANVTSE